MKTKTFLFAALGSNIVLKMTFGPWMLMDSKVCQFDPALSRGASGAVCCGAGNADASRVHSAGMSSLQRLWRLCASVSADFDLQQADVSNGDQPQRQVSVRLHLCLSVSKWVCPSASASSENSLLGLKTQCSELCVPPFPLVSSLCGRRQLLRERLPTRQDGGGERRPEAVWALQWTLPQRWNPLLFLLLLLVLILLLLSLLLLLLSLLPCSAYLSAVTANNGVWPPPQCVKAPALNTDRPWTPATLTASSTVPRSREAFTSWSRGFLGNRLPHHWRNLWGTIVSHNQLRVVCLSLIFFIFSFFLIPVTVTILRRFHHWMPKSWKFFAPWEK